MRRNRIYYNSSPDPTLGVEVELQILDSETLNMAPGAPKIIEHFNGSPHVKPELLDSIVEINTGICKDVSEIRRDLKKFIGESIEVAEDNGYQLVSMGTHPFAKWGEQKIASDDRYLHLVERMQWPLRRLLITGVHVHIGVDSGEKAIAITNGLIRYIPHMIAISANSPIYEGEVTGLASTRTKIFEAMPSAGLPYVLKNYSEFQKFMRTLQKANTIESIREVWWDIRPHPGFGTVEVRVYDGVPDLEQMVNLAALSQVIAVGISNYYDDGAQLPLLDDWIVRENKWRATRYGLDADLIVDNSGNQQSIKSAIIETIDKLMPLAKNLGCDKELDNIAIRVEDNQSPYIEQLRTYENTGDFKDILKNAVSELKESVMS